MSTNAVLSSHSEARKKITLRDLARKKADGAPITMITAYDYGTAMAVDSAGFDIILVGDSLGMVVLGYDNTLPVTMDEMLHHCKAVARGAKLALLVGDMPFMSYQVSPEEAVRNAGRFLQEAGMDAVKLEGGRERVDAIRKIVGAGIPVMGHLGLTPQSVHQLGGFVGQAKTANAARALLEDALILQEAGCFSIVLESIPEQLAALVSEKLDVPTLGIGAGGGCDGQVLVIHDVLGLFERFVPFFAKQYARMHTVMVDALKDFHDEVVARQFPAAEHVRRMAEPEWEKLLTALAEAHPAKHNQKISDHPPTG